MLNYVKIALLPFVKIFTLILREKVSIIINNKNIMTIVKQ